MLMIYAYNLSFCSTVASLFKEIGFQHRKYEATNELELYIF